jgi:CheY-like chemotaxis protein
MPNENKLDPQVLREQIGKHLRKADEFTRHQRYEEAILEIEAALKLDPKNNYARSFFERVKLMQKRSQPKETGQSAQAEATLEERMEIISRHLAVAEEFINKKDYKRALEEVAAVYKIDPNNYYAKAYSERIDTIMLENSAAEQSAVTTEKQPDIPTTPQPPSPVRGSTPMYRELLKEFWLDGIISEQEAMELAAMRDLFGITIESHKQLEHEVKIEAYLEALYIAGHDNVITDMEQKTLMMMRVKYGITPEEQAVAEARYSEMKHSSKTRGTILIVDADQKILESLSGALNQRGYTILLAQKIEDAVPILKNQTPNIIISELLFKNSPIDGVAFFKKLHEHVLLKQVPFIFISALKDKKVIHASLRLGANHYMIKPIDVDLLLAIIEGRLRA